jgi:phospholipid transport system substrate-binding protein
MKNLLTLLFVLFALAMAMPAFAADNAQEVVRSFYDQLTLDMKQGQQLGYSGRFKKLDPVIRQSFNLPLMTRLAVGSSWAGATPEEQKDLVSAFSDFSVASYASQFVAYNGEQFTVKGEKPAPDGNGVMVETTLKPKNGDAIAMDYLMRPDDKGNYRIVDVLLNGTVSQLATRRSEFSSIARDQGIPALVNSLDLKSRQMGPS